MTDALSHWVLSWISAGGYWGIAALMALENIFPPIPSELIMGLGGINVARGEMAFAPLLLAGTIGSTAGNYVWYQLGRSLGIERLRPLIDRHGRWLTMDWQDVEAMNAFFTRHGRWIVFAVRFSPLLRTMISLPAGLARMNRAEFLIYTALGAAVWNSILIGAGYYLGMNFSAIERYTGPVAIATIALILIIYVWRVLRWSPRKQED